MVEGANGNFYIQAEPRDERMDTVGANTILALDPYGKPLWRMELGRDNFDLVAGGYDGQLYGLRWGSVITSQRYTSTTHCEIVCIEPGL